MEKSAAAVPVSDRGGNSRFAFPVFLMTKLSATGLVATVNPKLTGELVSKFAPSGVSTAICGTTMELVVNVIPLTRMDD